MTARVLYPRATGFHYQMLAVTGFALTVGAFVAMAGVLSSNHSGSHEASD